MREDDFLSNSVLHAKLCISSCVLAELLRLSPAAVGIEQLVQVVGHPREEVELMCKQLYRKGLLRPDAGREGSWMLAADPASITLADLFSVLLVEPDRRQDT